MKITVAAVLFLTAQQTSAQATHVAHVAPTKQVSALDSVFSNILNEDILLPVLIDSAIKHNPEVNRVDNSVGLAKENLQVAKKNIWNAFSLFSSYNYGTTGNVTTGALSTITLSQSNYYNVGAGIQMPISLLITRKHAIKASEYQVKMAQSEKDGAAQYISQEVIRLYQELKLAHNLVRVASEAKQSALVNYQMTQKQFMQSDVAVSELSRIQDIYAKASIEFETDVNRFQTAYLQLENYTGIKLSNLINLLR